MQILEEIFLFIFTLLAMLICGFNYSHAALGSSSNVKTELQYLNRSKEVLDVSCFKNDIPNINAQYIFIGEDHFSYTSKKFLSSNATALVDLGFETIFVEYIESENQHLVDAYNKEPKNNVQNILRTFAQPGDWGYDPESYFYLTGNLSSSKMEIRGLDLRSELNFITNLEEKMAIRDLHMFNLVKDYIKKNPTKKIIFFNGWSHSFVNKELIAPSFYEYFINFYSKNNILNIKIDHYSADYISSERLKMESSPPGFDCENDFYNLKFKSKDFNFYIFENTKNFLPIIDSSIPI